MKRIIVLMMLIVLLFSCAKREKIETFQQLADKEFAVPTGTIADQLVSSRFKDAKFKYFNTVLDACLAVKSGKADAAAYDEPILRNIAAKVPGLKVLPEMITTDQYGFAVKLDNPNLKKDIDLVINEIKGNGYYQEMMSRWLPEKGSPAPMPNIEYDEKNGTLKFGTSSVTEPFSFVDGSQQIVGFDIEIAKLVAKKLNKKLEIINMDFGALIPSLVSGKVDMIGACMTISEERAKSVLFSNAYYKGGIAALIKE
jgi:polar amino acid transport system substrate-binding protein